LRSILLSVETPETGAFFRRLDRFVNQVSAGFGELGPGNIENA